MKIKVLFFARLAEISQVNEIELNDIGTTSALIEHLGIHYPQMMEIKFAVAINKQISGDMSELHNGDVVALIPPFSGG
ncbi:MAG: MoaD/ThiS family protein [Bacteroidetes bacterium]|nr:MoaD/ThiS family protein [Bacteroidota bacterium]